VQFSDWVRGQCFAEGQSKKVRLDSDLPGLIRGVTRNRQEDTIRLVLADKLDEMDDPAADLVRHVDDGHVWMTPFTPPGHVRGTKYPSARTVETDRTTPDEVFAITRDMSVYCPSTWGGRGTSPSMAQDETRPMVYVTVGFMHREPPPAKKVWNGSRSCYRQFGMSMTPAEARAFLDRHKGVFRTRGHRMLDAYLGGRGQNPPNPANLPPPPASIPATGV